MATSTVTRYYDLNSLPPIWDREDKQEWIVEGFIPKNGITVLTGATGSGKSSVMLAAADAVARGEEFLGHKSSQTPVLFVDRENPLYVYLERFARFNIEKTDNIKFWGVWDTDLEPQGPDYLGIEKYVEEHHPLIVFDSLIAFHPESEQDASETRRYMNLFRKLVSKGCSVVVIHHTGKGSDGPNKFYRGSSDIPANADVAWLLEQKAGPPLQNMHLTKFKSREGILANMPFGLDNTKFVLNEYIEENDPLYDTLDQVIRAHPNSNQSQLGELLPDIPRLKLLKMLGLGTASRRYHMIRGHKNASIYSLGAGRNAQNSVV